MSRGRKTLDLHTPPMRLWRKALIWAALLEIPLLIVLGTRRPEDFDTSVIALFLMWYHSISAFSMMYLFLSWNPEPLTLTGRALFFCGVFVIQVAITTPIIYVAVWTRQHFHKPHVASAHA